MTDLSSNLLAPRDHRSLDDVHRSVDVPATKWKRMFAFFGPAYMVAVGYMDPGNWATDIEGGARFGYALIWVLLMSNLMAVLLQSLAARLGVVAGRDLAQACREAYGPFIRVALFILCEIAIAACDLAEVLGTAIGLQLLTSQIFGGHGIPLVYAVLVTAADVFLLLAIQRLGIRKMEAFIVSLITVVGACFVIELFLSKPSAVGIAKGFIPGKLNADALYIAIGIIGATVMPHNLYLHSALVQSRRVKRTEAGMRQALKYNFLDSTIALNMAFLVNAAILIVAAAVFWTRGEEVKEIQQAHQMLEKLLSSKAAPMAFAIALICAGQSSTITGTLAGQITMEGFLHFRMRPWLRRLITRSLAILPAVIVILKMGEGATLKLLIFSQVILSLQLPFAVIPLLRFTSSRKRMGTFAVRGWMMALGWLVAGIIVALNVKLVVGTLIDWSDGPYRMAILSTVLPISASLIGLLLWVTFEPERRQRTAPLPARADDVVDAALTTMNRPLARIGLAVETTASDAPMIAEAIRLVRANDAFLVIMHVVEGVGGQYHGAQADDDEFRSDRQYLTELAQRLSKEIGPSARVQTTLGFGNVKKELVRIAREERVDLLILGGHGHRGLADLIRGTTIDGVRHGLPIPVLAVRA